MQMQVVHGSMDQLRINVCFTNGIQATGGERVCLRCALAQLPLMGHDARCMTCPAVACAVLALGLHSSPLKVSSSTLILAWQDAINTQIPGTAEGAGMTLQRFKQIN